MGKAFAQAETWPSAGVVMPGTICTPERVMRGPRRRLRKLGYGRADDGAGRAAKVFVRKVYEAEDSDHRRMERPELRGRCSVALQEVEVTGLSTASR